MEHVLMVEKVRDTKNYTIFKEIDDEDMESILSFPIYLDKQMCQGVQKLQFTFKEIS